MRRERPARFDGERVALAVLTAVAFAVVAWMASPLLVGLALGAVMGFTVQPIHERLAARMRQRRRLASAATALLAGIVLTAGGILAVWVIAREMVAAVAFVQRVLRPDGIEVLGPRATRWLTAVGVEPAAALARVREELGHLANLAAGAAGVLVQASVGAIVTLVVAVWTMYYVVLDWGRIAYHLERLLPLQPEHTRALVDEFRHVGRTAFVGTVASAIVQGLLAGAGFALCGVEQPITWAAVLALTSFVPVVGVPLVWVPLATSLLVEGHVARAVLLTVWCLVVVGMLTDYVIRPRLVGGPRSTVHPLLMLVAILGGMSAFGIAGIVVGPVIMSLFVASARIYERERETDLDDRPTLPAEVPRDTHEPGTESR
jgi:predicted PurR-regulated permease PerM